MLTRLKIGAVVTAVLLLGVYALTQTATDEAKDRAVTVTVTWTPTSKGATLVIRVGTLYVVGGRTFTKSPFTETYDAKRGETVLVAIDPIVTGPTVYCSIKATGMADVTNSGGGHFTCLTVVP